MKKLNKQRILDTAIAKHKSVIDDFKMRITELKESEVLLSEGNVDLQQSSLNEEMNDQVMRLQDELEFAEEELYYLNHLDLGVEITEVKPGAIVVTDSEVFFISASIERFESEGQKLIGISTKSPLFDTMKGLKAGSSFKYKNTRYQIREVY